MKVLVVAPFERDKAFGGSQRATAIAERLEARRVGVDWATIRPRVPGGPARAVGSISSQPGLVRYARAGGRPPAGDWDAAIAAHSYMAPQLDRIPAARVRVVDFHNLEWRHLRDAA